MDCLSFGFSSLASLELFIVIVIMIGVEQLYII